MLKFIISASAATLVAWTPAVITITLAFAIGGATSTWVWFWIALGLFLVTFLITWLFMRSISKMGNIGERVGRRAASAIFNKAAEEI